jgi:hypothetical protein
MWDNVDLFLRQIDQLNTIQFPLHRSQPRDERAPFLVEAPEPALLHGHFEKTQRSFSTNSNGG